MHLSVGLYQHFQMIVIGDLDTSHKTRSENEPRSAKGDPRGLKRAIQTRAAAAVAAAAAAAVVVVAAAAAAATAENGSWIWPPIGRKKALFTPHWAEATLSWMQKRSG